MTRSRNVLIALLIAASLLVVQGGVAVAGDGKGSREKPVPTQPVPNEFPGDPGFDAFPGDGGD